MFSGGQGRLPIGANQQRGDAALADQRLADLLAVEERFQRRAIENLLGPIGLDRRRAVKFQRPSGGVQNQISAKQPILRVFDDSKKTQSGLTLESIRGVHSIPLFAPYAMQIADFPP